MSELIDLLEGKQTEVRIGEYGLVAIMDCMPRLVKPGKTMDHALTQAARTSYGQHEKEALPKEDRTLVRYLMRHAHTTPIEMGVFKFYMALPIFVARQLVRHRMSTLNEYSMRYKEPKDECFVPDATEIRKQSKVNKQGSDGQVDDDTASEFQEMTRETFEVALKNYNRALSMGIGKEQARINLPVSTFTYWVWKVDLHNLLRTLSLRMHGHAQKEIRDYGQAFYDLIKPLSPWAVEAFDDYDMRRGATLLTRLDCDVLKCMAVDQAGVMAIEYARDLGWFEKDEKGKLKAIRERIECEAKLEKLQMRAPWLNFGDNI